jgi:hypothetical protein
MAQNRAAVALMVAAISLSAGTPSRALDYKDFLGS